MKNPFNREKTPKIFDQDEANKRMDDLFGDYARTNYELGVGFAAIIATAAIRKMDPVIAPVEIVGGIASLYGITRRARALGSVRTFRRTFGFLPKLRTAAEALIPATFPATLPAVADSTVNLLQHQTAPNIAATSAWGALAVGGLVTDIVRKVKLPKQNYPSPHYEKPASIKPEQNPDYDVTETDVAEAPSNLQVLMARQNTSETVPQPQVPVITEVVGPAMPPYVRPVAAEPIAPAPQPSPLQEASAQYTGPQQAPDQPQQPQSWDLSGIYSNSPTSSE